MPSPWSGWKPPTGFAARLQSGDEAIDRALEAAACDPDSPLFPWFDLSGRSSEGIKSGWDRIASGWKRQWALREAFNKAKFKDIWKLAESDEGWMRLGVGTTQGVSGAGEVLDSSRRRPDRRGHLPAGRGTSGLLSRRHNGVLQTPRFTIDSDYISFQVQGSGLSVVRLIVENYAVPRAGIYWQRYSPKSDAPVWAGWDTRYWKGFSAYLEFATMEDATNFALDREDSRKQPRPQRPTDGRSHFGALAVAFSRRECGSQGPG